VDDGAEAHLGAETEDEHLQHFFHHRLVQHETPRLDHFVYYLLHEACLTAIKVSMFFFFFLKKKKK
jgi:hypothetical protein